MMMMCRFARDVGVTAIRKIESLYQTLLGKKFKETKDSGATDTETTTFRIVQELGRGEVALAPLNEFGELAARLG